MATPILLPDGSKCWSGPTCKKHGHLTPPATNTPLNTLPDIWGIKEAKEQTLINMLPKGVRKGINNPDNQVLKQFLTDSETLRSNPIFSEENWNALETYVLSGYEPVNKFLRADWSEQIKTTAARINDPIKRENYLNRELDAFKKLNQQKVNEIDEVFTKLNGMKTSTIYQTLYRSINVKHVNTKTELDSFVSATYKPGTSIKENSYLSTSIDSDLMLYRSSRAPQQHLVFEIVSKGGVNLHRNEITSLKGVQSIEKEILLDRGKTFKVIDVKEATFQRSHPQGTDFSFLIRDFPGRKKFTVVQMIETE